MMITKERRNSMAFISSKKICPFKEDNELIDKIDYKEYKFLKKFTTL